jgi:hypothetical protein
MKIGTDRIKLDRGRSQEVEIHFSKSNNLFEIKLPDDIKKVSGLPKVTSPTYDGVKEEAIKQYTTFYSDNVTEVKLLAYRLQSSYTVRERVGLLSKSFDKELKVSNNTLSKGAGLIIDHRILYKVNFGDIEYYADCSYLESEEKPRLFSSNEPGQWELGYYTMVPYTEEVDRFLIDTRNKLNQLAEKVYSFFGKDPETLLNNVVNNVKLLN